MIDEAFVRDFYRQLGEAVNSGNMDLLDTLMAPGAIDHSPEEGQLEGLHGIKKAFEIFHATFGEVEFIVEDVVIGSDKVAVRLTTRGIHRGEIFGVAPTHREIRQPGIDILRFADGRMTDRWGVFDNASLFKQLGLRQLP